MRSRSIARQVVVLFLLVELLCALCMTGFVFVYQRHIQFHSLDTSLRGQAGTLLGAVVDAEDVGDSVVLDMEGIHLPDHDLYEVWADGKEMLGRSPGWLAPSKLVGGAAETGEFSLRGEQYRAVRVTGMRRVDPAGSGVRHSIVVVYASPTQPAWLPVVRAVRAFALAGTVLVACSTLLVTFLVQRSMAPLQHLARAAGSISSRCWHFDPPASARSTDELAPLTAALDSLLSRLRLSFAQQRQFVSDSAHELKTAITVVKSSLQLLDLRARQPEEYRAGVLVSLDDCRRMEDLVMRMLTLARVEEGDRLGDLPLHPQEPQRQVSELASGVLEAFSSIESFARLRGVRLDYTGPQAVYAPLPHDHWQTLCVNLLSNAVQHSAPGSRVTVVLDAASPRVTVRIIDRGEGISANALPFVFDRFYRGDASRARATGGSGLGLAIAKAIVEQAGGALSIESELGSGTTVTVRLAACQAPQTTSLEQDAGEVSLSTPA